MALDQIFRPQPYEMLDRLEADPVRAGLLAAIEDVLHLLSADPGNPRLGSITWSLRLAGTVVRSTPVRRDGWQIVSRVLSPTELDIIYIGPELPPE